MRQLSEEEMNILEQMPASVSGVGKETADPSTPTPEVTNEEETSKLASMIGTTVGYKQREADRSKASQEDATRKNIVIGANMFEKADIQEG